MDFKFRTKPYAHQLEALRQGADAQSFAYLMEMGTGKSKVTIDNAYYLYKKGAIDAFVVIAPKGVYRNWTTKEILTHCPEPDKLEIYSWGTSTSQRELGRQKEMIQTPMPGRLKVVAINVEAFSSERGAKFVRQFLNYHKALMVVDESTTIKNPKANRTKSIVNMGGAAAYRRILTGSPVTNSPLDLFSQMQFLDPKLLGFKSYFAFRARYAVLKRLEMGIRSFIKVVGYQRLDELNKRLSRCSYRVTKEECLDLPEIVYMRRAVELTKEQKEAYEQMKVLALVKVKEDIASTTIALTQMMRLHQIVCGHLKFDTGEVKHLPNNRVDSLMELLEECSGKVVIWANYREDISSIVDRIKSEYGPETVVEFHGGISVKDREQANLLFQDLKIVEGQGVTDAPSPVRFFVGNAQTGGMGIDLFKASHMIFYSNDYKLQDRIQAESRAHRNGLRHPITVHDLVAEGTVDEKIIQALREKKNLADLVTGDQLSEWI